MTGDDATAERRRSVEALAQALYEASDLNGVAWAKRTRIVRDPWLQRAEQQLQHAEVVAPGLHKS